MNTGYFLMVLMFISALLETFPQQVGIFYSAVNEDNAVLVPEAEGYWAFDFFRKDTLIIKKGGDNFYISTLSGNPDWHYEARFFRETDNLFMQLTPAQKNIENFVHYHSISKITINNDVMKFDELNYAWFYDKISKNNFELDYVFKDRILLITSQDADFRNLLAVNPADIFREFITLKKTREVESHQPSPVVRQSESAAPVMFKQRCIPEFPLKDGWLGGDGDLSLTLAPGRTMWFFSDTFVGKKDQSTRAGSGMVSNSIAIVDCNEDGQQDIKYYWGDMYSDNPRSIFDSRTDRYMYWLMDAFINGEVLYTVLTKIMTGSPVPTKENSYFDFTILGWTLAKVTDYKSTTPDKWIVEYIPWSHIFPPELWNSQFFRVDNYYYVFVNKTKYELSLMRFPCEYIENPEGHLEYYTAENKWKPGLPADDAAVMFTGNRPNSVFYHEDLNKWIMTIGPGFKDYKIWIRTADSFTGPWSEQIVVYETPEQIPGREYYHPDNYCYLAREHFQYYDPENKTMLITYDINTKDRHTLINTNYIYTPRVLSINLKDLVK